MAGWKGRSFVVRGLFLGATKQRKVLATVAFSVCLLLQRIGMLISTIKQQQKYFMLRTSKATSMDVLKTVATPDLIIALKVLFM